MRSAWTLVLLLSLSPSAPADAGKSSSAHELLKSGRVDEAISAIRQRLSKAERDAEARNLLARAYFALNNFDGAIREGERAVALAPNNAEYHLWLGRAYGRKAETANWFTAASLARKMRAEFERAVQLDGNHVDARSDLAEFYIEAPSIMGGGKDKAQAQAEAIEGKDAGTSHWVRARIAEKDKDFTRAETEYKSAIEDSGGRADNWLSLASFYRRRGRFAEMEQAITKAVTAQRQSPNKSAFFDAATLLWKAGRQLPQAAQLLAKYLASKEKVEDAPAFQAHYLLGQIYEKQGDRSAAAKQYQEALKLAQGFKDAQTALARVTPSAPAQAR